MPTTTHASLYSVSRRGPYPCFDWNIQRVLPYPSCRLPPNSCISSDSWPDRLRVSWCWCWRPLLAFSQKRWRRRKRKIRWVGATYRALVSDWNSQRVSCPPTTSTYFCRSRREEPRQNVYIGIVEQTLLCSLLKLTAMPLVQPHDLSLQNWSIEKNCR